MVKATFLVAINIQEEWAEVAEGSILRDNVCPI